jgi:predicted dehydrogenase
MPASTFSAFDSGKLSRRRFLKNSTFAATAAVLFPAFIPARVLGRDGGIAPSNRIALGVVGLEQGWDGFYRCLGRNGVEGVALCDVDKLRLDLRLGETRKRPNGKGAVGYRDFREMFASGKLDAVVLGAPDHWHGIMAVQAARAGLDIYGEKPLAHTLKEGRAIVEAVKQHGRIWQTGSWQRSQARFQRAVELVRNGRIGKLARVEVGTLGNFDKPRPKPQDLGKPPAHLDYELYVGPAQWFDYDSRVTHYNWRWVLNFGGGNLMDWVGHYLDIAHWGANRDNTGPVKVRPIKANYSTDLPYDAERSYEYECTYADGLVIHINDDNGTKFIGADGRWIFVSRSLLRASNPAILKEVIGPEEELIYKSNNHWENFIDCVRSRRQTITPAETAHRSASVGHLGHIACMTGRTLEWDPVSETIKNDPGANALLYPNFRSGWSL